MGARYQVVLGDLQSMAGTFHREARNYSGIRPLVTPTVAASGDAGLDSTITAMMDALAGLHDKLAAVIDDHGDKLQYAHDSYQRNDVDVHGVFEDLMSG